MAVIHRTIGVGGDYADIGTAHLAINAYYPLGVPGPHITDDWVLTVISDFTENTGVDGSFYYFDGHYVEIRNPDRYTITVASTGVGGLRYLRFKSWSSSVTDRMYFNDLIFVLPFINPANSFAFLYFAPTTQWNYVTAFYNNCVFRGNGYFASAAARGCNLIGLESNSGLQFTNASISNCKFGNYGTAFGSDNIGANQIVTIENCSAYDCYYGLRHSNAIAATVQYNVRNVVMSGSVGADYSSELATLANINFYNCADSDNTLAIAGGNLISCRPNIVPADEFQSTDIADDNWLKLKKGYYVSPSSYTGGAPDLGRTGTEPTLDGTDRDIEGEPRPGIDGYYSIGAHELEYITIKTRYENLIFDSGAVYMNFQSIDNPGTLLGATREGNVFTIEQELRDVPVDGAKGFVKNGRRYIRSNIKLTCNFIEHSVDLWKIAIPGSDTTSLPGHISFSRELTITDDDYIDNIVIIAQMSGTNQCMICGVKNALADSDIELGSEEGNEAGLPITFTAHYDSCNLDNEPFILMYPEEITTTSPTTSTTAAP